ncbi:unnamed protein product [Ranitomeya imitator]|uniref:peptidylprolyl isomerase n=1 Tax=Ranitomeya imitator TaxID=111125 RepID=A0ABN9LI72_9NEOB|nr:unnamed protein product [Ranitomeya imitator]
MTMPSCPNFILLLPVLSLLTGQIHCQGEEEKIKLEVTHVPSVCTQKSKRGDLVNAHYDGYLAKDLSKFYCRPALEEEMGPCEVAQVASMGGTSQISDLTVCTALCQITDLTCSAAAFTVPALSRLCEATSLPAGPGSAAILDPGLEQGGSRSEKDGHPKWFVLGVGQVIKGLDMALMDMCPGEKRKVTIPPSLGYGDKGYEKIPPDATLIFEIELLGISKGPRSVEAFHQIDLNDDQFLSKDEISHYLTEEFRKDGKKRDPSVHGRILTDIFQKNDHDSDGLISAREYNVYKHDELYFIQYKDVLLKKKASIFS